LTLRGAFLLFHNLLFQVGGDLKAHVTIGHALQALWGFLASIDAKKGALSGTSRPVGEFTTLRASATRVTVVLTTRMLVSASRSICGFKNGVGALAGSKTALLI